MNNTEVKTNKKLSIKRLFYVLILVLFVVFFLYKVMAEVYTTSSNSSPKSVSKLEASSTTEIINSTTTLKVSTSTVGHVATPEVVKGIYMSSYVAGSKSFRDNLVKFIDETSLNTIIIDVKDNTGTVTWEERVKPQDLKDFIKELHNKNIYVIARIATFQDPVFAKHNPDQDVITKDGSLWKDKKGVPWVDPASQKIWDYVIDLSKTSYNEYGFDEINFDYVRFPTDGDLKSAIFPISQKRFGDNSTTTKKFSKREVIKSFFEYINKDIHQAGIKTSADVFGMTATAGDDFGIGQMIIDAVNNFDYVSPMVYPSHFYPGTLNYKKPDIYSYEIIYYSMGNALLRNIYNDKDIYLKNKISLLESSTTLSTSSVNNLSKLKSDYEKSIWKTLTDNSFIKKELEKAKSDQALAVAKYQNKLRPWYQDFDMNGVDYGAKEVSAQIRAGNALGIESYLLWDASNKYTRGIDYDKIGQ